MDPISFFVPGIAQTKGSARGFGFVRKNGPRAGKIGVSITNDNPKGKAWAAVVSLAARDAMAGASPLDGPLEVSIDFVLPRPKSHFTKRGLRPEAPRYHASKPDGDKLVRCAWDALTGIAFADDSQIAVHRARKLYGEQPGAHFTVRRVIDDAVALHHP